MGVNSNRLPRRERQNVHSDYASRMSRPPSVKTAKLSLTNETISEKGEKSDAISEPSRKRSRTFRGVFNFRRLRKRSQHSNNEQTLTNEIESNNWSVKTQHNGIKTSDLSAETEHTNGLPQITEIPQAAGFDHPGDELEQDNSELLKSLHIRKINTIETWKRHSLAADFLTKPQSWNDVDDDEYFTSMVSLPGTKNNILARNYSETSTGNDGSRKYQLDTTNEKSSVVGTPLLSKRTERRDRLSLNLNSSTKKINSHMLKRNASDVSPYLQRHGIHGLPGPDEEDTSLRQRTGLSRSHSMFKPTKPTTPKPLKDCGSLSDSQFRLFCQQPVAIRRKTTDHGRPRVTVSESMCDLRPAKVVTWKRHSVAPVNEDIYEGLPSSDFTKSLGMLKSHVRKKSEPTSEVEYARSPERSILIFNKRKNSQRSSIISLANISTSSKINIFDDKMPMKPDENEEDIPNTNIPEAHKCFSLNSPAFPPNIVEDQIRQHDYPSFRHRVMSASFCYDQSVENYIVGYEHGHVSNSLESLDFSTSLSIPTDLDQLHFKRQRLEMSRNGGMPWDNDYASTYCISNINDIFDFRDGKAPTDFPEDAVSCFAEALWDHVTMDEEELSFRVGDVILVKNMNDSVWWWGELDNAEGWLPASFVRVIVNQAWPLSMDQLREDLYGNTEIRDPRADNDDTIDGQTQTLNKTIPDVQTKTAGSVNLTTLNKMRSNVVKEILNSERDFLKHLEDIVEGYLERCKKRFDMFSQEFISTVFSNIEDIYKFQRHFFKQLEASFHEDSPHESDVGTVFLQNKKHFEIYSEYCNNHPSATSKLAESMQSKKCRYFFEACRLLQRMIDISIDGYLLTPIQKICKYPLQLAELLKYTSPEDPNHESVQQALKAMQDVARMINERKRQVENIQKITSWQKNIIGWRDADVLDKSTELIYSGELYILTFPKAKAQIRVGFLFDRQFIICKKDLLRKDLLYYKTRLDLNKFSVVDSEDVNNDDSVAQLISGTNIKFWWKIQSIDTSDQIICLCKKEESKKRWIKEFKKEKNMSENLEDNRFLLSEEIKRKIVENTTLRCRKQDGGTLRKQTYRKRTWKRNWTKHYLDQNRNLKSLLFS